uniref:nicotinamidase n=1 Tax=Arion vulgaris TaxID=1028688 RepID=A0A0B7BEW6_9EUPU
MQGNHLQLFFVAAVFLCNVYSVSGKEDIRSALIIVDVQECFLPGGSLAVANGAAIIPVINSIRENNTFEMVVFTMDWHLPGHVSFASTHNKSVGATVPLRYLKNGALCLNETVTLKNFPNAQNCNENTTTLLEQKLWPDHCIQNLSSGNMSSRISPGLKQRSDDVIIHKGIHLEIDSYSAFFDNGNFFSTDLNDKLKSNNIDTVFITGLAFDICVFYTSLNAQSLGYETYTVVDAAIGIDPKHVEDAKQKLSDKGVHLIKHTDIQDILKNHSPRLFAHCLVFTLVCSVVSRKLVLHWLMD